MSSPIEPWMHRRLPAWETGFLEHERHKRIDYGGKGPAREGKSGEKVPGWLSHSKIGAADSTSTANSVSVPYGAIAVAVGLIGVGYCLLS